MGDLGSQTVCRMQAKASKNRVFSVSTKILRDLPHTLPRQNLSLMPGTLLRDTRSLGCLEVMPPMNTIVAFMPLILKSPVRKVITISTGAADTDMINRFGVADAVPYSISKAATNET